MQQQSNDSKTITAFFYQICFRCPKQISCLKLVKNMKIHHTIIRAAFVCVFVPYLLRGPLTDLRQTWWVYVGGPPICPWGVLFRKGQRVDGSTGHFHFPLYYICASLTPHSCKGAFCFAATAAESNSAPFAALHLNGVCRWTSQLPLRGSFSKRSTGRRVNGSNGSTGHISTAYVGGPRNYPWGILFRKGQQVDGSTGQMGRRLNGSLSLWLYYIW